MLYFESLSKENNNKPQKDSPTELSSTIKEPEVELISKIVELPDLNQLSSPKTDEVELMPSPAEQPDFAAVQSDFAAVQPEFTAVQPEFAAEQPEFKIELSDPVPDLEAPIPTTQLEIEALSSPTKELEINTP